MRFLSRRSLNICVPAGKTVSTVRGDEHDFFFVCTRGGSPGCVARFVEMDFEAERRARRTFTGFSALGFAKGGAGISVRRACCSSLIAIQVRLEPGEGGLHLWIRETSARAETRAACCAVNGMVERSRACPKE